MLIDTHTHLSDPKFDADREDALQRAFEAGVRALVEIADNEAEWPKARALAEKHPGRVFWTAGLHPHYADQMDDGLPRRLEEALKHPQLVAVGEIGLDYFRNPLPPELQRRSFQRMVEAAVQADKPLVLHCRESDASSFAAQEDMLGILQRFFPPLPSPPFFRGVLHCFQGRWEFAAACLNLGFIVGVDGPLTYPNARGLRDVIVQIPLPCLVLETDSPYLPPQDRRGKRNEPAYLSAIASALAELKGVSLDHLEQQTTANAEKLYRIRFSNLSDEKPA
jgi:TatD DNase family protein